MHAGISREINFPVTKRCYYDVRRPIVITVDDAKAWLCIRDAWWPMVMLLAVLLYSTVVYVAYIYRLFFHSLAKKNFNITNFMQYDIYTFNR